MKYITSILFVGLLAICLQPLSAQETDIQINKNWDHERHSWQAAWVTHPEASVLEYGVFLFRNEMQLDRVPDSLIVHLSADNRYRLWVNGKMVCSGPAKGSFMHWRYETLDLSPWLKTGKNVLAAEVFNMGEERPAALYSRQTALILQADGHPELNTPGSWQVMQDLAWQPIPVSGEAVGGYYVAGPTDRFEAGLHPWGWKEASYVPDAAGVWKTPRSVQKGVGRGYMHGVAWMLVPRSIPLMENKELRFQKVVRYTRKQSAEAQRNDVAGGQLDTALFLEGKNPWLIPANDTFRILLDQGELTLGYPVLHFEGGRGSQVRITYAESLRHPDGSKGNRSETEGKQISGYHDLVLPDGEKDRSFQSLWLRTWRYVQLDIVTGDEPLTLNDFHGIFEAYPFHCKGAFRSSNPQHEEIWEVGWRTARLCAHETYMDCPYYEQLQYLGDTRIQALISLALTGDDRLMRNALELADQGRLPEGLTLSRSPSYIPQVIPAFSLYWIDMIHDYYLYRPDLDYLMQFIPGIEAVLNWFERRIDFTGMLGELEWFNFADWSQGFLVGCPPGADLGHSALISLNYVYALDRAAQLFYAFAQSSDSEALYHRANEFIQRAERTRNAVYNLCFDFSRGLLSDIPLDDPARDIYPGVYSQHTNIYGILTDAIPEEDQARVMEQILSDTSLIQGTIYYRFYLFEAMRKVGMADRYTNMLGSWERMLANGLTTFQEGDYKDRSDCHAWSASPLYHFLTLVAGIRPAEPGFRSVEIRPALGPLEHIEATMVHPDGLIGLQLERKDGRVEGKIILPEGVKGVLQMDGIRKTLHSGLNEL